ncbi:MurR/RpiR family transcriptional regulator [Bhargavaea ullalensis]
MVLKGMIQREMLRLPRGQRKVAEYVMRRPHEVAVCSGQELGDRTGTSESTVIRFSYNMGYTGYPAMQKAIREELYLPESSFSQYQEEKLAIGEESRLYEKVMEQDLKSISETARQIDPHDMEIAVRELATAKNVSVLGLRASYPAANWLKLMLGIVRDDVSVMRPQAEDLVQEVCRLNEHSVVVVISFHRYLRETLLITELAKKKGAFVIGISDSPMAPVSAHCDLVFAIQSPGLTTIDKAAPLFSFMNALVASIAVKNPAEVRKRQELVRELDSGFYFLEGFEA